MEKRGHDSPECRPHLELGLQSVLACVWVWLQFGQPRLQLGGLDGRVAARDCLIDGLVDEDVLGLGEGAAEEAESLGGSRGERGQSPSASRHNTLPNQQCIGPSANPTHTYLPPTLACHLSPPPPPFPLLPPLSHSSLPPYRSLHHVVPLVPHLLDEVVDIHNPLRLHLLDDIVYRDEGARTANSSTAEREKRREREGAGRRERGGRRGREGEERGEGMGGNGRCMNNQL